MAVETNPKKKQAADNNVGLQDILIIGLKKWPWLLLSVCVCMGLALSLIHI